MTRNAGPEPADAGLSAMVVDANVVAKWFVAETGTEQAQLILNSDLLLAAPDLIIPELGSVLREKVLAGEVRADDAAPALQAVLERVSVVLSEEVFDDALAAAISVSISFYDSLYVALSRALGCPLVTADRRLIGALQGRVDFNVIDLAEVALGRPDPGPRPV